MAFDKKAWMREWHKAHPQDKEAHNARQRAYHAADPGKKRARRARMTPEQKSRVAQMQALRDQRRKSRAYEPRPNRPRAPALPAPQRAGSVLAAAAPSEARDLLARLTALAPRLASHDEIVAQAVLNVLEGMSEHEAVVEARRFVLREEDRYRYTKPIEDCFWL